MAQQLKMLAAKQRSELHMSDILWHAVSILIPNGRTTGKNQPNTTPTPLPAHTTPAMASSGYSSLWQANVSRSTHITHGLFLEQTLHSACSFPHQILVLLAPPKSWGVYCSLGVTFNAPPSPLWGFLQGI